jgi:hypothetical protein
MAIVLIVSSITLFLCLLLPSPSYSGYGVSRMIASNNLKQIGLGIMNYDSAMGSLPARAICDKDGKPLLSWRVAILPYMEEDKIYAEFKLNEPWDSEHNKALIPKMPKIYNHPMIVGGLGNTIYKAPVGENAIFGKPVLKDQLWLNPLSIADLEKSTRGAGNLILCFECGAPVVWSKPEDWQYEPAQPLPDFKATWKNGFMALMGDGRVISIRKDFKESAFRASLDPNSNSKETLDE